VASGAGLMNLVKISDEFSRFYKIPCKIIGFDSGEGMPPAVDYRDHPEKYVVGDFKSHDKSLLDKALPENANVLYGPIKNEIKKLCTELTEGDVVAFVSIDVDYYSSTLDCLTLFSLEGTRTLPQLPVYFDDVNNIEHNDYCGELLAINEFNEKFENKKISRMNQLRNWRIFKNALWLDQMFWYLDFESKFFTEEFHSSRAKVKLSNPYLNQKSEEHYGA
jgi:hypothetical protein